MIFPPGALQEIGELRQCGVESGISARMSHASEGEQHNCEHDGGEQSELEALSPLLSELHFIFPFASRGWRRIGTRSNGANEDLRQQPETGDLGLITGAKRKIQW